MNYLSVAVSRPVRGAYTYLVPPELGPAPEPGTRVLIPFGKGSALGFCLGPAQPPAEKVRLKPILRVLEPAPSLPADVLALLRFAADHYRYPLGEAIRGALPPGLSQAEEQEQIPAEVEHFAEALPGAEPQTLRRAPAQAATLSYLLAVGGRASVEEVGHAIPGARETLKKLAEKGLVRIVAEVVKPGVAQGLEHGRPAALTPEQAEAVATLNAHLGKGFSPFLLHGVTGSGKTEVYLRMMEQALEGGMGGLVLVPEIALTPQLVGRFRSRFGTRIAVLHSALRDKERLRHWQALRRGEVKIAVGVRSAIFAPVAQLGLIVVDEEHDPSFKQEEKLRYHARDLAVVRGKHAGALVILGSATPSLETLENVRRGRYRQVSLKVRVDDRPMPEVSLVDLRLERPREPGPQTDEMPVLAPTLISAMEETLGRGQQVILFLNRRGHSTFVVCEVCGSSLRCDACDVSLTHHRSVNKVVCHYCGQNGPLPEHCGECRGPLLKLGIGTERVEAEVAERFPRVRVARLDRDAASSSERLTELLASFARREIDVLVGTQMVAKGHDFPGVTLVCVVMADTSLAIPDFRASERTFQLLTQVGGRAGRGKEPGKVLIQTYHPGSDPIQRVLAHDFDGFSVQELEWRKRMAYPPFTRLTMIRIEGEDAGLTADTAKTLGKRLMRKMPPPFVGVRLLGPAPAPISRIKGRTRWQLLLKGPTHSALSGLLDEAERYATNDAPSSVKVVLDVDPGALL